jgi:hypothetical protein
MKCKKVIAAIAVVSSLFYAASAKATIILENPGLTTYQQTFNSPCIIGENSCNNPTGFTTGLIPNGNPSSYDVTSGPYTVSQIIGILGTNAFMVGIDVNTTTQPLATELLQTFEMYVNGVLQSAYSYNGSGSGTQLYTNNNGNGFSDELLKGFNLSSYQATDVITFRAVVNNATDGNEQFFLIGANSTPVPEPGTTAMLGAGLIGMGYLARRKQKNFL